MSAPASDFRHARQPGHRTLLPVQPAPSHTRRLPVIVVVQPHQVVEPWCGRLEDPYVRGGLDAVPAARGFSMMAPRP